MNEMKPGQVGVEMLGGLLLLQKAHFHVVLYRSEKCIRQTEDRAENLKFGVLISYNLSANKKEVLLFSKVIARRRGMYLSK